jgi:uncharacterized protein YneF (UPF0154 family)
MNFLNIYLGYLIYVGVLEITVFLLGAVVLGFFIHFFITSRRTMPVSVMEPPVLAESVIRDNDEWRIKYYEEMEEQESMQAQLRQDLEEARNNEEVLNIELEELRKDILQMRKNPPKQQPVAEIQHVPQMDYLARLISTQESLLEQNQNIARLIDEIQALKESEQQHLDTLNDNKMLAEKVNALQLALAEKEAELKQLQHKTLLAREMEDRLSRAYEEFNLLRDKLLKVETNLAQPQNRQFEYDELQQNYFKLTKEFDEIKGKHLSMLEENQRLSRVLADTEDKLRESNFQRQQLLKKITFLEELNQDLQQISEQNKKLENQLKRMSEIELMLARVSGKGQEEAGHAEGE